MSRRTDLIAQLPWVTRLDATQACDGVRWSHMTGKAMRDPELFSRYRCKMRARWQFTGLRGTGLDAEDGVFCWQHLLVQLRSNPAEDARARAELGRLSAQGTPMETGRSTR
jgi:hypothetical protein